MYLKHMHNMHIYLQEYNNIQGLCNEDEQMDKMNDLIKGIKPSPFMDTNGWLCGYYSI